MASLGASPWSRTGGSSSSRDADHLATLDADDLSSLHADMTPKEQQQFIRTLSKVNANVKLQLFYSEKRVEDLTAALGLEDGQAKDYQSMTKTVVEQSARIDELRGELRERNDIVAACSERIESLERQLEETRARADAAGAERTEEAVARATSMAAATAEMVLRELEDSQHDNSALMARAASAEAELASLRDAAATLEADVTAEKAAAAASLRRSMSAVASTQAAEQEIENLRHRLRVAQHAADEAAADREVAAAREAAVRQELAQRERLAAGSLETKVNEMMAAEASRREEHARATAEARAEVEKARAEADSERRRADAAVSGRRQAAADLEREREACDRDAEETRAAAERAVTEANARARIMVEEARERAARAESATMSGADDAVQRARDATRRRREPTPRNRSRW